MLDRKMVRDINKIAIPLILSSTTSIIMGIIDQALVGRISIYAYAGVGVVTSSINSVIGIIGAFAVAFNIMGSLKKGENDKDGLNETFSASIVLNVLLGSFLVILINLLNYPLLHTVFGLEGQTLIESINYIRIFSLSILLNLLLFTYSTVFKIFKNTSHILGVTLISNVINIVLDYVLIFGKFGFPELGSTGAAIGSVIALTVNLLIYMILAKDLVTLKLRRGLIFQRVTQLFKFSLPFIAQELMEDIVFVIGMNAIVARLGVLELSAYTLILQVLSVVLMPMFGYSTANLSLVSESFGEKDLKQCQKVTKYSSILSLMVYGGLFLFIIWQCDNIPKIMTTDISLIEFSVHLIPIAVLVQGFNYLMTLSKSTMQAMGNEKLALKVTFVINLLTLIVIAYMGKNLYIIYICMGIGYLANYIIFRHRFTHDVNLSLETE